jgi:endoglucanase
MLLKRMLAAALALLLVPACATGSAPPAAPSADATVQPLRRGVNIIGYDPLWKDPAKARFKGRHFRTIRDGGFDFVRIVLQSFGHMDAQNRIDPRWLSTLDWAVEKAGAAGLSVIIDEHDFNLCSEDVAQCREKLGAFWRQVAPRYRNAPKSVVFELLNEPHAKLDAATWNTVAAEMLAIVRETNPTRTVVIGPTSWNSLNELPTLRLPEQDRNILVTFHYYEPFRFTHQGAGWTDLVKLRGVTWGSAEDRERLRADFAKVKAWSEANRRPVLLGEFGAYDKSGTPIEQRVAYTSAVAREAEANGFPWAYWQFDSDFIVYDLNKDEWVTPIRDALIPAQ